MWLFGCLIGCLRTCLFVCWFDGLACAMAHAKRFYSFVVCNLFDEQEYSAARNVLDNRVSGFGIACWWIMYKFKIHSM